MLDTDALARLLPLFRTLSDALRLRLVGVLSHAPRTVESLAAELALSLAAVSQHLKRLTDLGLVQVSGDEPNQIYTLHSDHLRDLMDEARLTIPAESRSDQPIPFETVLALFRALSNERGLRLVAALSDGPRTLDQLVAATGLSPQVAETHLALLGLGELVLPRYAEGNRVYDLRADRFSALLDDMLRMSPPADPASIGAPPPDDFDQKTLRDFLVDGRLKTIPSHDKKRQVILRYLADLFEPGRRYPEREVNDILRDVHPDSASLRRYLVDTHLMARDHGVFWRVENGR